MAKQDLHFSITASNDDFKRKLAESRQAILDSAKTAEAQASRVDGSFKRMALSAAAGFSAISFGKSIIRVRGEMQMMEASFEVMLGSKAKANKMIAEIKQLAIDSPLEMPQVSSAVQTLLGYGVAADKVMGIVGQLSDVSKGNADQFRALSLAYAQVQSTGKLMGQDLLQMINAGFNPLKVISEQTGKSVGQLKEEMASGAISAEMVSTAFDKVTSAGGMFYQMTQKQAEGIIGLQATFEDAITNQLNKYGEKYEDLIAGGYKFATSVVENADTIVSALIPIITTYGAYKASVIAVNAIGKIKESSFAAVEIAELSKLLPLKAQEANADIAAAVAKGHLSQATAERLLAVRVEVQAELESLRVKAQALAAEAAAAAQVHKSALQRSVVAGQNMALAQSQMQIAIQGGNVEEIAAAKTAARTAKLEMNSSAIAVNTTRQALGTTQSNANAAAIAVDTMKTNLNTVATRSATTAKTLWTAATMRLTKAFHSLKLAFASNPIGMILTGVTMAISLFTMFGNSAEEAGDQTDLLNKSIADLGIETAKETQQIDNAFAKLLKAKKGTKEYGEAKDAIISKYGEYLRGLSAEVSSLNNVELAYNAVRNAAEDSIKARFKASFIEQANDDAAKKMGEAVKSIIDNVKGGFSDDFLKQFPDQVTAINAEIVNALTNTERTLRQKQIDIGAILEDYGFSSVDAAKIMRSTDFFDFGDRENFVETFETAFQSTLNIANVANAAFDSTTENQIKNGAKLETVLERRKRLTKELQDATSLLARMQADSSTSSDTEIEAQKKKITDLEKALNIDSKTAAKDYSSEVVDIMLKAEQLKIEVMQEGRAKELAQIEQTKQEKLAAIDKEQKEIEAKLKTQGKTLTADERTAFNQQRTYVNLSADKNTSAVNKKYDDEIANNWKALTSVFLSEEEKRTGAIRDEYNQRRKWLDEFYKGGSIDAATYAKFSIQIDASEAKEQLDTLTADYQTYADQRKAIETKFDADIAALQAINNNGKLNGNIAEVEKQKKATLSKIKIDETAQSIDFTHLFGNLDNLTLPSMKTLRDKIKAWIDEAGNSLAPEDLKAVSDAFQNLEIKIADKDPFAILKSSANELKTANEEVTKTQEAYNAVLVAGGQDSEAAKNAAEAYSAALEKRAAAVAKANEAIGSIADKGQQIVGAAQDVLGILSDLGIEVSDQTREVIDGIGKVMKGLGSIDLAKPMSVVTGSITMLGGWVQSITSLFGGSKKTLEELEYRQKEASEKQYFAELEISQLYRDRYEWAQKIGESTLQYMKRQGEELAKQGTDNAKEERALMDKLMNTEYKSGEHFEKTGLFGWGPGRIVEEHTSLAGKSWKEIELLASSGALSEEGMKYYEAIKKAKEEGVDLAQKQGEYLEKMREITTGSTYDSVVNGIVDGFKSGKRSASDFADSFGELMSGAVESALSLLADQKTREWYENFAKMGEDGYTKEEIATLKNDWIALNEQLAQDAKNLETVTGVEIGGKKENNEGSLAGQIRGTVATEQSVAELGGIFRGQHERLSAIDRKMDLSITNLLDIARTNLLIEQNTRRTADNTDGLRDVVNEVGKAISATNERLGQVIKNIKTDNGTI